MQFHVGVAADAFPEELLEELDTGTGPSCSFEASPDR